MKYLIVILISTFAYSNKYKVIEQVDCFRFFNSSNIKMFIKVGKTKSGYDLIVSSRDKEKNPFGLVAFAPSLKTINNKCSAQLIDFRLDEQSGELYAKNQFNEEHLIAKPKTSLPHYDELDEIFGIYREYELNEDIEIKSLQFQVRQSKKATGIWPNRDVYYYQYKNLNIEILINNRTQKYSSF